MSQYVCSVCGYVYDEAKGGKWEELQADWKCPLCGAGKDAFKLKEEKTVPEAKAEKPHVEKELSPMEMSIICSNLARGCEKQYLPQSDRTKAFLESIRDYPGIPAETVASLLNNIQ